MSEVKIFRLLILPVGQPAPTEADFVGATTYARFEDALDHGASTDRTKFDPYIAAEGLRFGPAEVRAIRRWMDH